MNQCNDVFLLANCFNNYEIVSAKDVEFYVGNACRKICRSDISGTKQYANKEPRDRNPRAITVAVLCWEVTSVIHYYSLTVLLGLHWWQT